jgi:hypothetical protein
MTGAAAVSGAGVGHLALTHHLRQLPQELIRDRDFEG